MVISTLIGVIVTIIISLLSKSHDPLSKSPTQRTRGSVPVSRV